MMLNHPVTEHLSKDVTTELRNVDLMNSPEWDLLH